MLKICIEGKVGSLTNTGDLVTDIPVAKLADVPSSTEIRVKVGDHETLGVFPLDHGEPAGTLIAVLGGSGFVEIGITGISIHEMLGLGVGENVTLTF